MIKPTRKASGKLFEEPETPSARAEGAYTANIDGAARGNPGPAAYGVIVRRPDGTTHESLGKYIGRHTNNVAEYYALIAALDYAAASGIKRLRVFSDSQLIVNQIKGLYKVKHPDLRPLHERAKRQAASGWHTAAATMRLLVTSGLPFAGGLVGLGGEIAWARPTRPGDTLRVESEILEIVPSRSNPNQAVVKVRNITLNQNGEQVQVLTTKILAFRRKDNSMA